MDSRCVWQGMLIVGMVVASWPGNRTCAYAQGPPSPPQVEQQAGTTPEDQSQPQGSEQPSTAEAPSAPAEQAAVRVEADASGLVSVDFKDADIRQVLRVLSLKSGVDIVASPDVEGLVTIKLTNVPWDQALDIILKMSGFSYDRRGNVVRVLTQAAVELEPLVAEVFPLNYAKPKEVAEILKEMVSDRGKVKSDERTNTVIVTDISSGLFQLRQVIERLDQATPQVLIESKIIETKLSKDENFGVSWSSTLAMTWTLPDASGPWPLNAFDVFPGNGLNSVKTLDDLVTVGTLDGGALGATLNALRQRQDTEILSHPTIVTLNNQEAFVQVGEDINIPNFQIDSSTGKATVTGVNTRSTGVILKVTPHVNPDEEIVMDIAPEITEIGATFDDFGNNIKFPRFTVQKAKTQVRLRDGQTVVIGGLVKRKKTVTNAKVPILGDIPIVSLLFSNRTEKQDPMQDLLIFLTVTLLKDPKSTAGAATVAKSMEE